MRLPPLGLYIHIPWCVQKCPYCDFNSHALKSGLPEQEYITHLLADLERDARLTGERPVETIFIGGGTPSLFSPESIGHLLTEAQKRVPFAKDIEITLEANPGTIEAARFEGYVAGGKPLFYWYSKLSGPAFNRAGAYTRPGPGLICYYPGQAKWC